MDGIRAAAFANPALTTVSQPIEAMAAQAVSIIISQSSDPVHHIAEGILTIRRSCGCPE
jgi:LacI family transcriptional regulator